ncbi:4a-hydroxytetrahydrobiopterin dehydratase [Leptospira sp. WS92.C1]
MTFQELDNLKGKIPLGWEIQFREEIPYLTKKYSFESYLSGVRFVNALAEIAEKMDHHPDLILTYRMVCVEIHTHSKRTITHLDVEFSKAAEAVKKSYL